MLSFLQLLDHLAKAFSASDVRSNFSNICLISETSPLHIVIEAAVRFRVGSGIPWHEEIARVSHVMRWHPDLP
jgi:hypothetical protein